MEGFLIRGWHPILPGVYWLYTLAPIKYTGEIVLNARLFFRFVFVLCGIALLTTPNAIAQHGKKNNACLLYTSPSPRD